MKKKNMILIGALALTIACPAFADPNIAANAESANCTQPVLGTTSGTSNLQASWQANTINIEWYDHDGKMDVQNAAKTCAYDSGITVPSTNPTKTGYTFAGWKVKIPSPFKALKDESVLGQYNERYNRNGENTCYGSSNSPVNCDTLADINSNEFKLVYENGTIYGEASCNNVQGSSYVSCGSGPCVYTYNNDSESADTFSTADTGEYCWCRFTGYTPTNGTKQTVLTSRWVYYNGGAGAFTRYGQPSTCARECSGKCVTGAKDFFYEYLINATE